MEKVAKYMKATLALLVLLNLGMAGLYVVIFRLDAKVEAAVTTSVQANPLAAEWTCTQGLRHRLTTAMLPDDTAATQAERHALRLAAVLSIFPEAESPR